MSINILKLLRADKIDLQEEIGVDPILSLNSKKAGGFQQIAPHASSNNGKTDRLLAGKTPTIAGLFDTVKY